MTVFVTADLHFDHAGILRHCADTRPFDSVDEMNDALVTAWNETVSRGDEVHVLGDFAFGKSPGRWFHALNGKKHLTVGNHDEQNKAVLSLPWTSVEWLRKIRSENRRAVACHYPLETWHHPHRNVMLHGHSHGSLRRVIPRRQDVGVDVLGFAPVPFVGLVDGLLAEGFVAQDHHGG